METLAHTSEIDGIKYACKLADVDVEFQPTDVDQIVNVVITDKGEDISNSLAYTLAGWAKERTMFSRLDKMVTWSLY